MHARVLVALAVVIALASLSPATAAAPMSDAAVQSADSAGAAPPADPPPGGPSDATPSSPPSLPSLPTQPSPAAPPGNRGADSARRLTAFMAEAEAWLLAGQDLPPELLKLLEPMLPGDRLIAVAYLRRLGLLEGAPLDLQRLLAPVPEGGA